MGVRGYLEGSAPTSKSEVGGEGVAGKSGDGVCAAFKNN